MRICCERGKGIEDWVGSPLGTYASLMAYSNDLKVFGFEILKKRIDRATISPISAKTSC
jgi:hypothetical protein